MRIFSKDALADDADNAIAKPAPVPATSAKNEKNTAAKIESCEPPAPSWLHLFPANLQKELASLAGVARNGHNTGMMVSMPGEGRELEAVDQEFSHRFNLVF